MESILNSTKKLLGIEAADTSFDTDIIIHINTVLALLNQLGVGPAAGFSIVGENETWTQFLGGEVLLNEAKSYVYLQVRLLFDPPGTSFLVESMRRSIEQLEWRMTVQTDPPNTGVSA